MGRTVVAAMVSGLSSKITGGTFANGAMTATFVHLFNAEGMLKQEEKENTNQCPIGGRCSALMKLIEFDDQQSSPLGVTLSKQYNLLRFSEDTLSLNSDYESIGSPAGIDWMLRSTGGSLAYVPGVNHLVYGSGKVL